MAGDPKELAHIVRLSQGIGRFVRADGIIDKMRVDLIDLVEASKWFLEEINKSRDYPLTLESTEDLLISLDVNFVCHASFHINSLRDGIEKALSEIGELTGDQDSTLT
jgi:hypothetical protein